MPVFTCQDCGYEFFDERGESAQHDAVCRHLGVQTPHEIRGVREAAGLSRTEFCELGGFGIASLQRWETGEVIPNASSDRLIYLLQFKQNLEGLRARDCGRTNGSVAFAKPCQPEPEAPRGDRPTQVLRHMRPRSVLHFPALERQGELIRCQREAERIRMRGFVLAPGG